MKISRRFPIASVCFFLLSVTALRTSTSFAAVFSEMKQAQEVHLRSQNSPLHTESEKGSPTRQLIGSEKVAVLQHIFQQQASLNLCPEITLSEANLESSQLYLNNHTQYLAVILCHHGAYQGRYEFVHLQQSPSIKRVQHSGLTLAGLPMFDKETHVLKNSYKFTGRGECVLNSSYVWHRGRLELLSVDMQDSIENGCQNFNTPQPDTLITSTSAGVVALGMTLGELKQRLPQDAIYEFNADDLGSQVDFYPLLTVRYHDKSLSLFLSGDIPMENPTIGGLANESKILAIRVNHPGYMTAEGVRVGTRMEEAIAVYGPAIFSYVDRSDSGEEIQFETDPLPSTQNTSIRIRPNNSALSKKYDQSGFAGIYSDVRVDPNEFLRETQQYREDAAIGEIWLIRYE